ncbi:syntenin-1-like isoform X1 [Homalodisca vitripennis]|uniref:syntenin-1-like isoform X1 n=1 Tax=Homalodisca vitripennis TaxID=197043 RepID=UPI001EEBE1FC|nr:syntenin-1-like isoform X1 [Homalodisca vitripennis]
MALYPTVPIQIQLTDYELETPHLGVAPIYSVVPVTPPPPPYNPHLYPPLYDVEPPPPPHNLPQFVALVGIHPMHQKSGSTSSSEPSRRHSAENKAPTSEEKEAKITTKEVILNKKDGKFGMKLAVIHKNIFIYKVTKGSSASQAGLKLGDQIVKVNGTCVSGLSNDNVHDLLRRCPQYGIKFTVRSRSDLTVFKKLDSVKKSFKDL